MNGGSDMHGYTYHFWTSAIASLTRNLGSSFATAFDIQFYDPSSNTVKELRVYPELLSETFELCPDNDGDGHMDQSCGGDDCDDSNGDVYPGAAELCDLTDNQCPGDIGYLLIDEGCTDFVQVSPPLGAVLPEGPTMEWTADDFDLFLPMMRLPIRGVYWSIKLPWIPITVFDMRWLPNYSFVWCSITPEQPIYWWVVGLNTRTWRSKVIGPSVFFKTPPT